MPNAVLASYMGELTWTPVSSSNVAAVAYQDSPRRYLWVRFRNGSVYAYQDVPEGVYRGLLAAPSKGEYVYQILRGGARRRDSVYVYDRVV